MPMVETGNRIASGPIDCPQSFFPEQGWHLGGSTTMSGTQARGRAMTTGLSQRRPLHNEQSNLKECHDQPSPCHWRNGRLHTIMRSTRAGRSSRTASTSVSRPPGAGRSCSFLHNFVALSGYHAAPEPEGGMSWPAQTVFLWVTARAKRPRDPSELRAGEDKICGGSGGTVKAL